MPRGYRLIILAAVGWLIPLAALANTHTKAEIAQAKAQQSAAKSLNDIAAIYYQEAERAHASRDQEPCKPGDDKRYSEICAEWKSADYAYIAAWLSGLSFIAVLFALYFAFRSNAIARESAKRQLRAYVSFCSIDKLDTPRSGVPHWKAQIQWINEGQTPATQVHSWGNWRLFDQPLPADFDFPRGTDEAEGGAAVMGPKQLLYTPLSPPIPLSVIPHVAAGGKFLYLWGEINYVDAFEVHRRTEWCAKMVAAPEDGGEFGLTWLAYNKFNAIDDDCLRAPKNRRRSYSLS